MNKFDLQSISNDLRINTSLNISNRGEGKSEFLFIFSALKAIEISVDNESYFVEYWNNYSEDCDDLPVISENLASHKQTITKILDWFNLD